MNRPSEIVTTGDGSVTLYVPDLEEHYHSVHGAIEESRHVFIQGGLLHSGLQTLRIFEMGFGTGLNALLTCLEALSGNITIQYDSIDLFPLEMNLVRKLNYPELLPERAREIFNTLHSTAWNETHSIDRVFNFTKIQADLLTFRPETCYHVIYFDAFSPRAQPALWGTDIFRKMYDMMHEGGVLMTYSVTGWVRRNLEKAGFHTEKLPGPPGKREILRAMR